jgi:hypothetical protein
VREFLRQIATIFAAATLMGIRRFDAEPEGPFAVRDDKKYYLSQFLC